MTSRRQKRLACIVGITLIYAGVSVSASAGFGLLAFILYLPGGLAEILRRIGDLATAGVVRLRAGPLGPAGPPDTVALDPEALVEEVLG